MADSFALDDTSAKCLPLASVVAGMFTHITYFDGNTHLHNSVLGHSAGSIQSTKISDERCSRFTLAAHTYWLVAGKKPFGREVESVRPSMRSQIFLVFSSSQFTQVAEIHVKPNN